MGLLKFFRLEPVDKRMGEDGSEQHQPDTSQQPSEKEMPVTHACPP